jgi:predicted HicB family RNase H-like nuclease
MMKYKGYEAIIEYDAEDRLFFGRVININDIIVFDGLSVDELEQSFQTVIDHYLADCQISNKTPETRLSPVNI